MGLKNQGLAPRHQCFCCFLNILNLCNLGNFVDVDGNLADTKKNLGDQEWRSKSAAGRGTGDIV